MTWSKGDLSQYNSAKSPWYSTHMNGKVDIGLELGPEEKLGLSHQGMLKLVKDWIKENSELTRQEREELIELLQRTNQGFKLP